MPSKNTTAKPPAPPSKAFDGAKKGFLNNNAKLYDDNEAKKRTTEYEPEFDAAMAELDPEFSNASKNEDAVNDEDDTIAQLRDFAAKVDWASSDFSKPLHPARDYTKHDHSQRPKPAVETEVKKAPGSRKQDPGELQRGFMARDSERAAAKAAVPRGVPKTMRPLSAGGRSPRQTPGPSGASPGGAAPPAGLQAWNFPRLVRTPALASTALATSSKAGRARSRVVTT